MYPANQGRWIWMISPCMNIIHIHIVCLTMGIYVHTISLIYGLRGRFHHTCVWSTSGGCNYRGWRCGSDPRTARTFSDYEDSLPAIHRSTVATTWRTTYWSCGSNICIPHSTMSSTRQISGKGIHRRVLVPINWKEFILVDEGTPVWVPNELSDDGIPFIVGICNRQELRAMLASRCRYWTHAITKRPIPESSFMPLMQVEKEDRSY